VVGLCILGININEKLKGVVKKEKKIERNTCPHEINQEEIKKVLQS
jgi:hypothetical protein